MKSEEQTIISEERVHWLVALWPDQLSLALIGPVILFYGTEEQKQGFVPPIVRGEVICYKAFTEPNIWSDESNIELRDVRDGDYYILNGHKTLIYSSRKPDWLFATARTKDIILKHRGLSLFMVPGDAPVVIYHIIISNWGIQTK